MKHYAKSIALALLIAVCGVSHAARDGSGNYSLPSGNPVSTGTTISSTWANNTLSDIATALTSSIAKDGQTTATANLPMGGFKHTNVADGTARNQYATTAQLQDLSTQTLGGVSGTNSITGSLTPTITSYATGMLVGFTPANANTGATTIAINGLAAKSIVKNVSTALVANDLLTTAPALLIYNGTNFVLLNPQASMTLAADGSVAAPSITFAADTDTGLFRNTANDMRVSVGGVLVGQWLATGQYVLAQDGNAAGPAVSFLADPDTGFYRIGSDNIGVAVGGTLRLDFSSSATTFRPGGSASSQVTATQSLWPDGAAATPGVGFYSDPDTGLYRVAANQIGVAVSGSNVGTFAAGGYFAVDGSASTPSLSFATDADTGFYRIGADQIGFAEGGTGFYVGFRNVPQNAQTGNYTAVLSDAGKHIYHASGAGAGDTYTIPANASVAYSIGTTITFINSDSNSVTIAITSDTLTLAGSTTTGSRTCAQNCVATAIKVTATSWIISGPGVT